MFKKVFLEHWIDWTIAIIIMIFIVVWGAVQQFSIEQDSSINGNDIFNPTKSQTGIDTLKNKTDNPKADIMMIDNLLASAGIEKLGSWSVHPRCGPRDEFLGYQIIRSTISISSEQALKLKSIAADRGYTIDDYGQRSAPQGNNYSIKNSTWVISVVFEKNVVHLYSTFPVKERPKDLPYAEQFCG
jgi:hypothetical protein